MGISVSEFWELTPQELNVFLQVYKRRRLEERRDMLTQAYFISRWVWAKNIPIERILKDLERELDDDWMTDEAMFKKCLALNAMFGGSVEKV